MGFSAAILSVLSLVLPPEDERLVIAVDPQGTERQEMSFAGRGGRRRISNDYQHKGKVRP